MEILDCCVKITLGDVAYRNDESRVYFGKLHWHGDTFSIKH